MRMGPDLGSLPGLFAPGAVTWSVAGTLAVGIALAAGFAYARGAGRDALERLAAWAGGRGLDYIAAADGDPTVVATFAGSLHGADVTVEVRRVPRRALVDLPPQLTLVAVEAPLAGEWRVQPAAWVMDELGSPLSDPVSAGSDLFEAQWAAYGHDAARALSPALQDRLLREDARVIAVEASAGRLVTRAPGVLAEPSELDARVALVADLAALLRGARG